LVEQAAYHLTKVTNKDDQRQSKRVVITPGEQKKKKRYDDPTKALLHMLIGTT
jgi:hypothetical protein